MNAGLGARIRSVDVYPPTHRTIELLFGGYLFRVIAPEGVYNVSGQIELGMSVTLWEGEHLEFEGLMGKLYKMYAIVKTLIVSSVTYRLIRYDFFDFDVPIRFTIVALIRLTMLALTVSVSNGFNGFVGCPFDAI